MRKASTEKQLKNVRKERKIFPHSIFNFFSIHLGQALYFGAVHRESKEDFNGIFIFLLNVENGKIAIFRVASKVIRSCCKILQLKYILLRIKIFFMKRIKIKSP
jgi:hypothetical protein